VVEFWTIKKPALPLQGGRIFVIMAKARETGIPLANKEVQPSILTIV